MTNITITHAETGVIHAEVLRSQRISPNFVRVTLTGDDLRRFEYRGFDQWFRLALPVDDSTRFDNLPSRVDTRGYLKFLMLPKTTRPVIRNYTVRAFRPEGPELDIDFVVHGTEGVAGPWSAAVEPGERVAFIDQGCGWKGVASDYVLLVADETGLPAVASVLRDLPREATGHAVIEVPDLADQQPTDAPDGVTVRWVAREGDAKPGTLALDTAKALSLPAGTPYVFVVGESALATGLRRWAVSERGVPKSHVTFCGYWKQGHGH
ncbi:NADPH-dependent ferric siderophore reductase [Microbacteriaceae bacterium SG_E_30_P1]|uniref:NADPH-dependent ferric siderophore reductase n=1 Tax=Antiquaquibacter oligotrophicus TaxID=2880260 RepID=A0ABT6KQJ9_9MICO|nr:siderophore-interacting protein [Antiquaquibacter oligotrophicus]MDH6182257.1 NADPH-dependent ferric siderophore reductase [Antiquaquibacter oligotrophicus]UDF12085.1 siderophore-interacting protein [Antiquaquibacter oligotrophicus]